MNIIHEKTRDGGRYLAQIEGHSGEMTYTRITPQLISIDHTVVPQALRGKGVAQALALHAVEEARKGGWKITPVCSFFKAQAERHPEWQDILS